MLGLAGQTEGKAIVVEHLEGLRQAVLDGRVDLSRRIDIFSQTTKNPVEYEEILGWLSCRASELTVHRTICSQVASRHSRLSAFASSHDVIVFVSGKASSNGKVLCELCEGVNPRTHHIDSVGELRGEWFRDGDNVGVCGATSTPKWLLEDVAGRIREMA